MRSQPGSVEITDTVRAMIKKTLVKISVIMLEESVRVKLGECRIGLNARI